MSKKLSYFLGLALVCIALSISIHQLQMSRAAQQVESKERPKIEANDPEVEAILEREAELIRKMNEEQSKVEQSKVQTQAPEEKSADSNQPSIESLITEGTAKLPAMEDKFKLEYELGYSPENFRDPFSLPVSLDTKTKPAKSSEPGFDNEDFLDNKMDVDMSNPYVSHYIKDYKISGILWGVKKPKALVLAPSGQLLTVHIGTRLGREGGVAWSIREKEVVFLMPDKTGDYRNGTPLILRMRN
jgi:Tfp pilus assembly protein PilP